MTAKADRAKALLEDPMIKDAFAAVRERYRDMIEETPLTDSVELITDIRKMLHLLRDVENHFYEAIQNGALEDFRVKEQEGKGFLQDIAKWPKQT